MTTENISVSVRVRPLNEKEADHGLGWAVEGSSIVQLNPKSGEPLREIGTQYSLDSVFGPGWSTTQVYEATTRGIVRQVLEGFNGTVFAYGQTSSGKTHTMRGDDTESGIIPLAIRDVFSLITSEPSRDYLVRASYMELYNEEIRDLLAPENCGLAIRESKETGVYVSGLREDLVTTPDQVLQLLAEGEAHRHVGETKMNKNSSRSHTIFRMVVESRGRPGAAAVAAVSEALGEGQAAAQGPAGPAAVRVSALTLVDLAGSERVSKTGAEGARMKEGTAINKSLLTLGTVINKLAEGDPSHIPYRDSKLTRILQPSLGGNAKTAVICAVTPAVIHAEETHSTLRFACRAKKVQNHAVVNEVVGTSAEGQALLRKQQREIEELKRRLASQGSGEAEEIAALRQQLQRAQEEIARIEGANPFGLSRKRRSRSQSGGSDREAFADGEGEEEEGYEEGPTPQRRKMTGGAGEDGAEALRARVQVLEEELRETREDRERLRALQPQLEAARWKTRQLERRVEELQGGATGQEELQAMLVAQRSESQAREARLGEAIAGLEKEKLRVELEASGLRDSLALARSEAEELRGKRARAAALESEVAAQVARLKAELSKRERDAMEARAKQEELEASLAHSEERARELYEETRRLETHCQDLQTQKRAPLYQRKQEAELKAALDKAIEMELKAADAELRLKEARQGQEAAERALREVEEGGRAEKGRLEAQIAATEEAHKEAVRKLTAQQIQLQAKYDEEVAVLRRDLGLATADREQLSDTVAELRGQLDETSARFAEFEEALSVAQQGCQEAQQCADAAAERNRALEDEVEMLTMAKEGLEGQLAAQAAEAAAVAERLQGELTEAQSDKASLEAELNRASAGIKVATELKELKSKYKVEMAQLQREKQAAEKQAKMGTQKGSKEVDLVKKELERLKDQLKKTEEKLRGALGEKSAAVSDKAKVELALKQLQSKHESVAKALEKKDSVDAKRREELQALIDGTRRQLAATASELEGKKADVARLEASLSDREAGLAATGARLEGAEQLAGSLQAQLADLTAQLSSQAESNAALESLAQDRNRAAEAASAERARIAAQLTSVAEDLATVRGSEARLKAELASLSDAHRALKQQVEASEAGRRAAEARLHEIPELQLQVTDLTEQLSDTLFRFEEEKAGAWARDKLLTGEKAALEGQLKEATSDRSRLQAELVRAESRALDLEARLADTAARAEGAAKMAEAAEAAALDLQAEVSSLSTRLLSDREASLALELDLKGCLESTELRIGALGREVAGRAEEVATLQAELERVRAERASLMEDAEARVAEARRGERAAEQQLEESARGRSELSRHVEALRADKDSLERRLSDSAAEVAVLRSRCDAMEDSAAALRERLRGSEAVGEAERARVQALARDLSECQAELEGEKTRARTLQLAADTARQEAGGAHRAAQVEAARAARAEEELEVERQRTATLSEQIRSLDTVASECKDLIDRQAARVASLEKELGAVHRRAEKEKEEIMLALSAEQRKGSAVEDARRAADELKSRISGERDRADRAEAEAAAAREVCGRLQTDLGAREEEVAATRSRVAELEGQLAQAGKAGMEKVKLMHETTALQQRVSFLEAIVSASQMELRAAIDRAEAAEASGRESFARCSALEKEAEAAKSQAAAVAARHDKLSAWARDAQKEVESLRAARARATELEAQVARLSAAALGTAASVAEMADLQAQFARLQSDAAAATARVSELEAEVVSLQSEAAAARSAAAGLEKSKEELSRRATQLTKDSERQLASIQRLQQEAKRSAQQPAPSVPEGQATGLAPPDIARLQQLEAAYREEKRNNVKLQALYNKIKTDVVSQGVSEESFKRLWEASAAEFDKDYADNKIRTAEARAKRYADELDKLKVAAGRCTAGVVASNLVPSSSAAAIRLPAPSAAGSASVKASVPLGNLAANVAATENPLSAKRHLQTVSRFGVEGFGQAVRTGSGSESEARKENIP